MRKFAAGDRSLFTPENRYFVGIRDAISKYPNDLIAAYQQGDPSNERLLLMGKTTGDYDFLLGTARGTFSQSGELLGVRDTFNFDSKNRGGRIEMGLKWINQKIATSCPKANLAGFPIKLGN